MPIKLEKALIKSANKKGLKGERKDAYVWGTMNKIKKAEIAKYHKSRGKM